MTMSTARLIFKCAHLQMELEGEFTNFQYRLDT